MGSITQNITTVSMRVFLLYSVLHLVVGAPQNNGGTFSAFSNFNPNTQTFTSGSSQTFSTQDTFFQGVDQSLDTFFSGGEGLGAGFTGLGADTGDCDDFCQNARRLEEQSLNQFKADLKSFEAQLSNSQGGVGGGGAPVFSTVQTSHNFVPQQPVGDSFLSNKKQPAINQIRPNSFNNLKPVTPRSQPLPVTPKSQPTFTKPKVTPFAIFNRPSTTPPTTTQRTTTVSTTQTPTTTTTIIDKKEENKNSKGVSIPVETATRKPSKIKFTFNGKTLGGSKTTTKRSIETDEKIPISTFFNQNKQKNEEEGEESSDDKILEAERDFPVFDAVETEDKGVDGENTNKESKFLVFDAVPK